MVKIVGVGHYCPENTVSNDKLSTLVDTSHEWIVKRTGIYERKISNGESTVDLAVKASINAMNMANCKPKDIDLIIVATTSPDRIMPSTACSVQDVLGCINATAFDITAACSGFLYATIIANSLIKGGEGSKALVIGSEVLSRIVNWNDRNTCVLFGDGAGAAILEISTDNSKIISTYFGSDGKTGTKALMANQFPINTQIIHERIVQEKLNIDKNKFYVNLESYGNTSSASVPIALSEAINKKLITKGDKIILVAFGGGLTWAGVLLEF